MGMNITNFWKLFCYGVKRDRYEKLIGIREFLEQLAQYLFKNTFSPDTGTPAKNTSTFDKVNEGQTVSTCHVLHFSISIYTSA